MPITPQPSVGFRNGHQSPCTTLFDHDLRSQLPGTPRSATILGHPVDVGSLSMIVISLSHVFVGRHVSHTRHRCSLHGLQMRIIFISLLCAAWLRTGPALSEEACRVARAPCVSDVRSLHQRPHAQCTLKPGQHTAPVRLEAQHKLVDQAAAVAVKGTWPQYKSSCKSCARHSRTLYSNVNALIV